MSDACLESPWREDFPIFKTLVHGKPLVYLDSAASSQKPYAVINAVHDVYQHQYANVHRGVHALSDMATTRYEQARDTVTSFIGAKDRRSIIFVRGATEGVNLVARSYLEPRLKPGDEVLITALEHHANIVPWQQACQRTGAKLKVVPINEAGEVTLEAFEQALTKRTRFVAMSHVSNALGTVNAVRAMTNMAHEYNIPVLIDGAQAVQHQSVNVTELDCEFYVFSGHKIFAPSGTGVLYGKLDYLESMDVYQTGGEMILKVSFDETTFNDLPYRFEAGTPNIEGVIGLGEALNYLQGIGIDKVAHYEHNLLNYAEKILKSIPGLRIIGQAHEKVGVISFVLDNIHAHDVGTIVDQAGVAIRTGHHCAMPTITYYQLPATARASLALYNNQDDIDRLAEALDYVTKVFNV